jgi:hypothetical protein
MAGMGALFIKGRVLFMPDKVFLPLLFMPEKVAP